MSLYQDPHLYSELRKSQGPNRGDSSIVGAINKEFEKIVACKQSSIIYMLRKVLLALVNIHLLSFAMIRTRPRDCLHFACQTHKFKTLLSS